MVRATQWRSSGVPSSIELQNGSRVGVVGGGPAGSFFSFFLLENARRLDLRLQLDIFEPRDFTAPGPAGCNMCGGIVSESLVQNLAAEGIRLPTGTLQRGIDSYALHMDVGDVRIETPLKEKRIAAVHRGAGPRGMQGAPRPGLDAFLLGLATGKGARLIRSRVDTVRCNGGRPVVRTQAGSDHEYDLLAVAVGVNSSTKLLENSGLPYLAPHSTKTYICEFCLGREMIERYLGSSMHVFLLNMERLDFAALIPKGEYVTACLLGRNIDKELVRSFLESAEVRACMPPGWEVPADVCHCSPKISISAARHPFSDRVVFIGDCGSTRLYKDGIGAAYRTSKAAAITAIFDGIAARDFRREFWLLCRDIANDNRVGKFVYLVTRVIQRSRTLRRGVWRMVAQEQSRPEARRRMSSVLWDLFTGSAPYTDVLLRTLHPAFVGRFIWEIAAGAVREGPANGRSPCSSS